MIGGCTRVTGRAAMHRGARRWRPALLEISGALLLIASSARATHAQSWEGMVVEQGQTTYYIEGGEKRLVEEPASAACLGKTAVEADSGLIASLPLGPPKIDCEPSPHPVSLFD